MANDDKVQKRLRQSPPKPKGSGGRGPNKPTYKGRRMARPSSRGRHGGK
jgi:hypothetical protein